MSVYIFSHCCLTVACHVLLLTLERKLPSHGNDFQTCGVYGPGASLPHCPREHFKPTNQSHFTGAKGQVPGLFALPVGSEGELPMQTLKLL